MRARAWGALSLVLSVAAAGGCRARLVVSCDSDAACVSHGVMGSCREAPSGGARYCAFSDVTCPDGGPRWDPTAADGLAGECLGGGPGADGGSDGGGSTDLRGDMAGGGGDMGQVVKKWVALDCGCGGTWLTSVWGASAVDVYAVGLGETILRSRDRGKTWMKVPLATSSESLNGVWGSSATDILTVGSTGLVLRGDGMMWTKMATGTTDYLYGVHGSSASMDVFAVGSKELILHRSGGGGWTQPWKPTSGSLETLNAVWVAPGGTEAWAVGTQGRVLHTVDRGAAWSAVVLPNNFSDDLYGVWGFDATNLLIAASGGTIFRSGDAGKTWTVVHGAFGNNDSLNGLSGSGAHAWAVGSYAVILHSSDAGMTWARETSPVNTELFGVWSDGPDDTYIVGHSGTILRWQ